MKFHHSDTIWTSRVHQMASTILVLLALCLEVWLLMVMFSEKSLLNLSVWLLSTINTPLLQLSHDHW
jgi:hypothetical protein